MNTQVKLITPRSQWQKSFLIMAKIMPLRWGVLGYSSSL